MSTPASSRWGYDVSEIMFMAETILGTKNTTGVFLHFGQPLGIDPRPKPQTYKKVGLGHQIATAFPANKRWGEGTLNYQLEKKDVDVGYEYSWMDAVAYVLGDDGNSATVVDEKHLKSVTIGAKLDVTTDEFWTFLGCKFNTVEISGDLLRNDPVNCSASFLAQDFTYNTTDYAGTPITRKILPNTGAILASDVDIEIPAASSIYSRISAWTLRIHRNLVKRGGKTGAANLYRNFEEGELEVSLKVAMDFDTKTELDDFIASTPRAALVEIPTGVGGRAITLTGGVWRDMAKPLRELDLISISLTADYTDISVGTG